MHARPGRERLITSSFSSARSFAPRFLPTVGRPSAVAFRFVRCDQLTVGLAPTRAASDQVESTEFWGFTSGWEFASLRAQGCVFGERDGEALFAGFEGTGCRGGELRQFGQRGCASIWDWHKHCYPVEPALARRRSRQSASNGRRSSFASQRTSCDTANISY